MVGIGLFVSWVLDWGLWGIVLFVVLFVGIILIIGSNLMGLLLSKYLCMVGIVLLLVGILCFGMGLIIGVVVVVLLGIEIWLMIFVMVVCFVLLGVFYWMLGRKV